MKALALSLAATMAVIACGGSEQSAAYEVTLDVRYEEELRVPGTGYVLHELALDYVLAVVSAPGELIEPAAAGTSAWTVRCYEDQFVPERLPFAEFSGTHPAVFEWELGDLRRRDVLESGVDWTAGPAVLLVESGDAIQVVHRLPAAVAADREIGCDPEDQYTAIAISLGDAAMTAPGRIVTGTRELTRAEALNEQADRIRYYTGDDGSGWLVQEIPKASIGPDATPFSFAFDPGPEPEAAARVSLMGTVRVAPAE